TTGSLVIDCAGAGVAASHAASAPAEDSARRHDRQDMSASRSFSDDWIRWRARGVLVLWRGLSERQSDALAVACDGLRPRQIVEPNQKRRGSMDIGDGVQRARPQHILLRIAGLEARGARGQD